MPRFVNLTATIPRDGSLSNVVDCSIGRPIFIHMPPAWTSAQLSFQVSSDGVAFNDLFTNKSQELSFNVASGTSVRLNDAFWAPVQYVKLRSGSRDKATPQAAARDILVTVDTGEPSADGTPGPAGPTAVSADVGNLAKLGTDSLILVPNTSVLKGTTAADNAAAGMAGEQLAVSQATPISLTTGVTINVATLALPPGDWSCSGVVVFDAALNTLPTMLASAMSAASATLPTVAQVVAGSANMTQYFLPFSKSADHIMQAGIFRMNVSSSTSVFLVAQSAFSGGTLAVTGYMSARRVR